MYPVGDIGSSIDDDDGLPVVISDRQQRSKVRKGTEDLSSIASQTDEVLDWLRASNS